MIVLALYYVRWHYSQALADLMAIIRNFVWFFYEFFSIPLLLKTFFVPFNRLEDTRKKKSAIDFEAMAERTVVSLIMRVVGMALRTTLIIIGVVCIVASVVFGVCFMLVWLLAPLMLVVLVMTGLTLLATG